MERKYLEKFINDVLKNKNGKLEGQRLNESWFKKNGYFKELEFFLKNDILDTKKLYIFLTGDDGVCTCGRPKRFKGFKDGFTRNCSICSRTRKNWMKESTGNVDIELDKVPCFVKTKNGKCGGKYSTSRIKQLSKNTIDKIIQRTSYLDEDATMAERIYHIEHGLTSYPKCKLCKKDNKNFRTSKTGYFPYCKNNCSYRINENLKKRKLLLRKHHFEKYLTKYKTLGDDYAVNMFSYEDYILGKDCKIEITHLNCRSSKTGTYTYKRDIDYQGHLKCPKCFPIRSRKQYEIYEELSKYTSSLIFNDRNLIKPREIDILCPEYKFGIEYDSLTFHSFGAHKRKELNKIETIEDKNAHVLKTELMESKGYQLFRIFSNEWIKKKDIWISILKNKMHLNKRIFARKCIIREISHNQANEFLEKNHLQGGCRSSIRLGLIYNDELVSVMTFGKSRYNKEYEYEMLRFCSKLDTVVVGGASKLLKYFIKNYKPKSIISFANRRWSTGDLYEKLGFKFLRNTKPNYFYFKGRDSATLISRVQFQKHKLKEKLENFDERLTETENMYNNGYRKIYDCGNKVYVLKIED